MRWRKSSYPDMSSKENVIHSRLRQAFLLLSSLCFYPPLGWLQPYHSLLNPVFPMRYNVIASLAFTLGTLAGPCKPNASGKFCEDITFW